VHAVSSRPIHSLIASSLALSLTALPPIVRASPPSLVNLVGEGEDGEAKAAYRAGSDAYALGNYEEAVQQFERAFQLSQAPALLFNLGQAYTRWYDISNDVEHLKKARRLYENYVLSIGATDLDEEQQAQAQADAQRRITEVDRRIAAHEEAASGGESDQSRQRKPVHKAPWFWLTIVGSLAVVGGVTAAIVITRRPGFEPELGTIGGLSGNLSGGLAPRDNRLSLGAGGLTLRF
jgi:tetratricopeptide (TPR) repeat protein